MPPANALVPSNVILFELIWLSSQTSKKDFVMGWGAFPLVNGAFQLNEGKFKLPLLNGKIDFWVNKFKDIETKYRRNVDEWLCNMYIEIRKIPMLDFRKHKEKIEFRVDKTALEDDDRESSTDSEAEAENVIKDRLHLEGVDYQMYNYSLAE